MNEREEETVAGEGAGKLGDVLPHHTRADNHVLDVQSCYLTNTRYQIKPLMLLLLFIFTTFVLLLSLYFSGNSE